MPLSLREPLKLIGAAGRHLTAVKYYIAWLKCSKAEKLSSSDELMQQDASKAKAEKEVNLAIDRLIYYAGWCDKYQQLFSSVNLAVASATSIFGSRTNRRCEPHCPSKRFFAGHWYL